MNVFISWSGTRSKAMAEALREWLPDVVQYIRPWMSAQDIGAGARWSPAIEQQLRDSPFGIICLTQTNQTAPWILFEAGALAKSVKDPTFVCPLLIGFDASALAEGPLTQFQAKSTTRQGMLDLVLALNSAAGESQMPEDKVIRAFGTWWPAFEAKIESLPPEGSTPRKPQQSEMIEEILLATREIKRAIARGELAGSLTSDAMLQSVWAHLGRPDRSDDDSLAKYVMLQNALTWKDEQKASTPHFILRKHLKDSDSKE